jgi:hypothetical protein
MTLACGRGPGIPPDQGRLAAPPDHRRVEDECDGLPGKREARIDTEDDGRTSSEADGGWHIGRDFRFGPSGR